MSILLLCWIKMHLLYIIGNILWSQYSYTLKYSMLFFNTIVIHTTSIWNDTHTTLVETRPSVKLISRSCEWEFRTSQIARGFQCFHLELDMSRVIVCYGPKHTTIQARICFYAFIGVVLIIDVLYAIIYAQLTNYGFTYKLTLMLKVKHASFPPP
jgi:hypothetical protein